jgi:hypothetical protein
MPLRDELPVLEVRERQPSNIGTEMHFAGLILEISQFGQEDFDIGHRVSVAILPEESRTEPSAAENTIEAPHA